MINVPILVIDDDIHVLSMLETTFTTMMGQGFDILTATTANSGLNKLKEKHPAIVIVDVRLGPVSGMDLLKDFNGYFDKVENRRYKPRYIVITAYQDEKIEKEAREVYKVDSFLLKPFKSEDIRRAVAFSLQKALGDCLAFIKTYTRDGASEEALKEKENLEWRKKKIDEDMKRIEEREK